MDSATRQRVHPHKDVWSEHFEYGEGEFIGLTSRGRATVAVLNMNDPDRLSFVTNSATNRLHKQQQDSLKEN